MNIWNCFTTQKKLNFTRLKKKKKTFFDQSLSIFSHSSRGMIHKKCCCFSQENHNILSTKKKLVD